MKIVKLSFVLISALSTLYAQRIGDIANVIGVRDNQLIGYGLVVGLNGTGDGSSSQFTLRSLSNLLQTVNVKIDPADIKSKNVAAVLVTAKLPAFARQGDKVDVSVSSIGDAKSLQGGNLILTPLKGVDGKIYSLAQGSLTIGGMNGKEKGQLNHPASANIFGGAIVEREIENNLHDQEYVNLSLKEANFNTAVSIQNELNKKFGKKVAVATDSRTIRMMRPENLTTVEFLAKTLDVDVKYEKEDKIVIDERTGTIVSGVNIKVDPVVVTHGDITIKIEASDVPLDDKSVDIGGDVQIASTENRIKIKKESMTVANIARALTKLGAKPKDIISILENIKRSGAITASLEII
ncbi:flagellar basal body P-ring protein FlgI [Sulfurospirillum diekertiae]|uniref:Flagellar P-ring protein n=1 Tax=Sulfurospirillum diekertiae TaxID=1854492 RepID=A0A1Y0HKI9_9BACT|nr:flagellar basal body P-ring protein FlgI [Sulfurospirillum diekertiae]ARU48598.1 Flagellar P-ring protein [Sulfurospirillum diekertiae]ASC93428.1 Flagellar P-ring protein [Sulfurospirillum diekertiae]QIR77113.2 flagellar basal body P-ring protein FlgI [Sulfurospirillum diekertiae]QIR79730.2 flagellar basal body P-ring protein FlgI [Sulfurospirillum diekertiae]